MTKKITDDAVAGLFSRYHEAGNMSEGEGRELARLRDSGDPEVSRAAIEEMVLRNIPLAADAADRFSRFFRIPYEDCFAEAIGVDGLLKAAKNFDPDKAKFTTYATWLIMAVCSHIKYHARKHSAATPMSCLSDGEDGKYFDPVDYRAGCTCDPSELPAAIWDCLDEREASIIRLRFGLDEHRPGRTTRTGTINLAGGLSLEAIGKMTGCSRERIRQIEARALDKLNRFARKNPRLFAGLAVA